MNPIINPSQKDFARNKFFFVNCFLFLHFFKTFYKQKVPLFGCSPGSDRFPSRFQSRLQPVPVPFASGDELVSVRTSSGAERFRLASNVRLPSSFGFGSCLEESQKILQSTSDPMGVRCVTQIIVSQ